MPSGVYIRTKGMAEETKRKIGNANKERILSEEHKRKLSISHKGKIRSKEHCKRISEIHKGMHHSDKTRKKISKALKGRPARNKGVSQPEEHGKKISKYLRRMWQNPKWKEKRLKAISIGLEILPTKPERRLKNGLNKMFPREYKYVGDGNIWIGGKCPDFINVNGQKKIIELFGDYWHGKEKTGRTKKQEENQRIKHFAKYGFRTLIIWENELKNVRQLKEKLLEFCTT